MVSPVRIRVPPLKKVLQNQGKHEGSGNIAGAHLLQPYCNRVLAEGFVHSSRRRGVHSWKNVAASIEGDRCGGVAEELLDNLGVDPSREEQRSAGVTEVVKPDPGHPRLLNSEEQQLAKWWR